MAKRTETYLACDLCNRAGAKSWTIRNPDGEQARVDVCPRCSTPLTQAFTAGRRTNHGPVGSQTIDDAIVDDYSSPVYSWTAAQEKKQK